MTQPWIAGIESPLYQYLRYCYDSALDSRDRVTTVPVFEILL